jgi:hypothetical protein
MTLAADNVRVRALISAMREAVNVLGTLAVLPEADFLKDVHKIGRTGHPSDRETLGMNA